MYLQMLRSITHKQQWHAERLSVWSVYFNFNSLTCQNYFVQRVWGVCLKLVEIPEGWGGYFCVQKMEIPGRTGGLA